MGRLNFHLESEIRQAISVMMAKLKKGNAPNLTRRHEVVEPYLITVMQIFQYSEIIFSLQKHGSSSEQFIHTAMTFAQWSSK